MGNNTISFLAFFIYLATFGLQYFNSSRKLAFSKPKYLLLGSAAIALHAYVLYIWIDTPIGQNLSLSHLFSLTCWLIALGVLSASIFKPIENLSLFVHPIAAASILLAILYPGLDIFRTREHPSMLIHILISILAFGLLGMAALQASLLYLQNQCLRSNASRGMMRILPPLQTMETLFFQIIWSGFLLLSILVFSALFFLDSTWNANHLQKISLSVLAWGLFATILFAHHYSGLRGIKAIRWTLIGVGLLTLAYLAGKYI